jgi:hypothetical protein
VKHQLRMFIAELLLRLAFRVLPRGPNKRWLAQLLLNWMDHEIPKIAVDVARIYPRKFKRIMKYQAAMNGWPH